MQAYRVEKVLEENGRVVLEDFPFVAGQRVEIIVLPADVVVSADRHPLRDTPYRFEEPFVPLVDPTDWEVSD